MATRASQTWSRPSLCGVPGSGASNASAQSVALSQTSPHGVSTSIPSVGASSYNRTAGSIAPTMTADAFSAATSASASSPAASPSATRSRTVQVRTPSSPRLGSTSAT